MASFRKSLGINFAASSGATIVQFIVSLIVARILTPAEIGVYSIAMVLVAVAHVFREFGVGSYLQRVDRLSLNVVRSAMAVAYLLAFSTSSAIFLGSDWVAAWFGYAEIGAVMRVLALSFLLIPFSSVALALLLREYDAARIAVGTIVGTAAYTVTCLSLALGGYGALSLAWASLANVLATGLVYIWARPLHMSYLPRFREVGEIVKFGTGALVTNLIKAGNDAVPDLVLGKIGSARQVGLVSRANSTVHMFLYIAGSALTFGSQTYLSKAYHAGQSLEPMLHRAISLVTGIGWPMLIVTAIAARDVIVTLYGSQWVAATPVVLPLAIMAAIELTFHYKIPAFNAIGRPALAFIPLMVTALLRVALGIALYTGDLVSFGWALMLATAATAPVWLWLQRRYLGCGVRAFAKMLLPSALVTLACGCAALGVEALVDAAGVGVPILRLTALGLTSACVWLISLKLTKHPLFDELLLIARKMSLSSKRDDTTSTVDAGNLP